LEHRELVLLLDELLAVGFSLRGHDCCVFLCEFHGLVSSDLVIEHVLCFGFLDSELFGHDHSVLFLLLKVKLESHSLLFLCFELLFLLVGFRFSASLFLVLEFKVLFVDGSFLREDFEEVLLDHLFLSLQIFDAGLGDADINAHEVCFLSSLHEGTSVRLE